MLQSMPNSKLPVGMISRNEDARGDWMESPTWRRAEPSHNEGPFIVATEGAMGLYYMMLFHTIPLLHSIIIL